MAVGKSSLGRVANANVIASASPEVTVTVVTEEKVEQKQNATKKVASNKAKSAETFGKIFKVGDKLPEYLL